MADLVRYRVQLPHGSDPNRGPGWTDLFVRDGTSDVDVVNEIFVMDVYHTRSLLLREPALAGLPDGAVMPRVLDIGACSGVFSALACQLWPDAQVLAVEPDRENVDLLHLNTQKWRERVTIQACAVGATAGKVGMVGDTGTGHTITEPDGEIMDGDARWVDQVTLESLIDGQPVALLKCLDATTRVPTRRGCIPIIEIVPGDEVWRDGRWRAVQAIRRSPTRSGIELRTDRGRRLRLTVDHRLWSDGRWIEAGRLQPGVLLVTTEAAPSEAALLRCPWPPMHRVTRHGTSDDFVSAPDAPRVEITERWGRLLGLYAGDGSCGSRNRIQIACDGQDQDLVDQIIEDFHAIGLAPGTERVRMWSGELLRKRTVNVASAQFVRFLISLGVAEWREPTSTYARRIVTIPEVIWRSPRGVLAQFLAGLFEADGSVSTQSSAVTLSTKWPTFARDIQLALSLLGIEALVREHRASQRGPYSDRFYSHVRLRRAAVEVFAKEVGFLSRRKRERLQAIIDRPAGKSTRPQQWSESVESIIPCMVDPVDIQVDGEVFAAAGFVSHNCDIEGGEYAMFDACPSEQLAHIDRITLEWHGTSEAPWVDNAPQRYGELVAKLGETHAVNVYGRPSAGGYLFAHRYD